MYYVILTHKQQGCRSWRGHERTLTGRLQQRAQLWNDKEVCKSYLNVLFVLYFDNASLFKVGSATLNNILSNKNGVSTLRGVSHKQKRQQQEAKELTIIFKVLQLLTYNPYPDVQKCYCRDKVLQPLTELKVGKTIF